MPELPEVETIVRELKSKLIGRKFWGVEGDWHRAFLPSHEVVVARLKGLEILDIVRRGKFIVFELDQKMRLVIHLRMSGRLLWKKQKDREQHLRAIFAFSDATRLYFADTRKFGRIWLFPEDEYEKATGIARLGVEPFSADFTLERFSQLFKRKGILKNTLLRQDLIAGIGNIYADEICFRARLHPSSRLGKLRVQDLQNLYEAIRFCLQEGIAHNGASVSDFVGTRGTLGKHQLYLQVYGRKGCPCYRCGTAIQKIVAAGRGTFFCPHCQRTRVRPEPHCKV